MTPEETQFNHIQGALHLSAAPVGGMVTRYLHSGDSIRMMVLGMSAGMDWNETEETHQTASIFAVLNGEGRLSLGKVDLEFGSGDWFQVEAGQPFILRAATDLVLLRTDTQDEKDD